MYLDLIKKCLLDTIYGPLDTSGKPVSKEVLEQGSYWPLRAHTMIGEKRLNNIQQLFEKIVEDNVPGDLIETGVWRGGATIFMKALVKYYDQNRKVYVADSFEGLPPPDPRYPRDRGDQHHTVDFLRVTEEQVKENFRRYDLLDDDVVFVKGFFEHSLKKVDFGDISILRLDGDMYSSTIQVLDELYDKVPVGGFVIIDDYALGGCKAAVDDFRKSHDITDELVVIDYTGRYWRKSKM